VCISFQKVAARLKFIKGQQTKNDDNEMRERKRKRVVVKVREKDTDTDRDTHTKHTHTQTQSVLIQEENARKPHAKRVTCSH